MSRTTQTTANLAKAQAVRSSAYPTRVHELPEFKQWFDTEYSKGGKTLQALHREAVNRFKGYKVPSVPRLKSYVEKYLSQPVIVAPYTPEYQEHIRNFDSYIKLLEAAKELWRRYEAAERREELVPGIKNSRSHEWIKTYLETLRAVVEIEVKLGLRTGLITPQNVNLNQVNISNSVELTAEKQEEIITEAEVVADYLRNYEQLRANRNGARVLFGDEGVPSPKGP